MADKYNPHLIILPEDRANEQIVNGFLLNSQLDERRISCLKPCKGWKRTLEYFLEQFSDRLRSCVQWRCLLLIDFDMDENRYQTVNNDIPEDLKERVFILGSISEPEELKNRFNPVKSYEEIGKALAQDCVDGTNHTWDHELLRHNEGEIQRMIGSVKPFLFNF